MNLLDTLENWAAPHTIEKSTSQAWKIMIVTDYGTQDGQGSVLKWWRTMSPMALLYGESQPLMARAK